MLYSTTVYFYGTEEALDKLFTYLKDGSNLGNTLKINKIWDDGDGYIAYSSREDATIDIESRWSSSRESILKLIEWLGENIEICSYTEERGSSVFEVYDPANHGAFADFNYFLDWQLAPEEEGEPLCHLDWYEHEHDDKSFCELVEDISGQVPKDTNEGMKILCSLKKNRKSIVELHEIIRVS